MRFPIRLILCCLRFYASVYDVPKGRKRRGKRCFSTRCGTFSGVWKCPPPHVLLPEAPCSYLRSALLLFPEPRAAWSVSPCCDAFRSVFFAVLFRFVSETEVSKRKQIGLFPSFFPRCRPCLFPRPNLDFRQSNPRGKIIKSRQSVCESERIRTFAS